MHIENEKGGSLCGTVLSPQYRHSTPETHDSNRFCRICLAVYRARKQIREAALKKAYRNRPRRERVAHFAHTLFGPLDLYTLVPVMLFRITFFLGLALFVGGASWLFGWTAGLIVGVVYMYVVWHVGVLLS